MIKAFKGKVMVPTVGEDGTLIGALVMTPDQAMQFAGEIMAAAREAANQRLETP